MCSRTYGFKEDAIHLFRTGIGKSIFLYYLLHQLACLGKTVVWHDELMASVLLYTPNGVFQADSIVPFTKELENPSTWFLCDGVEPVSTAAITVMASLPRSSKYQKYDKEGPIQLWMGPWSVSELKAARDAIFTSVDADELQRLYVRWGGIPRFVLRHANNACQQQKLDEVIAVANPELIYKAVCYIEGASDYNHKLLHVQVNEKCEEVGRVFGSVEIAQRLQQLLMRQRSVWFDDLLYWSAGKPELASLRAQLFECAAHEALCKGGAFRVRSLSNPEQQVSQLKVGQMEQKVVWDSDLKEVNLETTKSGCLMVPVLKDFPAAVDSFLLLPSSECRPGRLLFILATFTAQRPISVRGLLDAVQKLSGDLQGLKRELYFAVPPELFDSFTEQHFDGLEMEVDTIKMEQYAIEVPVLIQHFGSLGEQPSAKDESPHGLASEIPYLARLICFEVDVVMLVAIARDPKVVRKG
ncbi:hypothetical protein VOLCADRAFT_105436 [Volvox carteri f. nagariensis]|uniref:Uncharacterized protein n=1 Tax=Volvox carteri f. nagariensis TaxID=3068 RepID=D8U0S7_VOLCA|nr:uncharacterized protein VOLCADRAFT_105436 [Volvox carteri f. nagariensis]EFJ46692.1 hypothetical protein VOLCADRAFT_105436 [Volvox carteri f. nagariensis]|eukprot:XP_002952221.1 hypothetical protein VOLCADRAFT_105436 [Volvox carteri f. nagariensis]